MAGKRNDESRLRGGRAFRGSLTAAAILSVLFLVAAFSSMLHLPYVTHAQTGPATVLDAPALTADDTKANRVELSWRAVDGAARYELWRWEEGADDWILIDDALTATMYTDSAVEAGKAYTYAARGLTADGAEGAWSDYKSDDARATVAALDAPALTADDAKANRVELSWRAVDGAARYELWRWEEGADDWILIDNALTATTYTDSAVEAGKRYTYAARGLAADGAEGAWSDYSSEEARATGRGADLQEPTPTPTAPATATATHTATATPTKSPTPMPTATPTATPTYTAAPAEGSSNDDSEGGGEGSSAPRTPCVVRTRTANEDLRRCQRFPHPTATPTMTPTITPTPTATSTPTPGPSPTPTHTSTPPPRLTGCTSTMPMPPCEIK